MRGTTRWLDTWLGCWLAGAGLVAAQTPRGGGAAPAEPTACAAPEFRQFSFWVWEWDVRQVP